MSGRRRAFGVSIFTVSWIVACTGGGGSPSGGPAASSGGAPGDVGTFLAQYCDLYANCCAQISKTYDQGKCRAFFTASVGQTPYDGSKAEQCLNGIRAESQSATFCDSGPSQTATAACEGVFAKSGGTGQPGAPCSEDTDCAASSDGKVRCASAFVNNATTKQCQVQAHGSEGDDCIGTQDGSVTTTSVGSGPVQPKVNICSTADNLYCPQSGVNATKKCTRSQDVGGACSTGDPHACLATADCDSASAKCVARKAIGQACTSSAECAAKTAYCNTSSRQCTDTLPNGGKCAQSVECASSSCVNQACAASGLSGLTLFVCD